MGGVARVLARFDALGARYELYEHPPVERVCDRGPMGLLYGGATVCKNLLLTTRNRAVFILLMIPAQKSADLKAVARTLRTSRLCFAGDEDLLRLLGQRPGCVGVTGVINDAQNEVRVLFDRDLKDRARVAMHPGDNTKTLVMPFFEIERFVKSCGASIDFIDL